MGFTAEEMRKRAFNRTAVALYSFWEEQKDNEPRTVGVHSRIFDTLIYNEYIELNEKSPGYGRKEHVVPCAFIRNYAFDMYRSGHSITDVANMIERLLCIAYISDQERKVLDAVHKDTMPDDWNPDTDSPLRRLEDAGITIRNKKSV